MIKSKVAIAFILSALSINIAYAEQIDLINIANNSRDSHTCVYTRHFNDTEHWDICSVCGIESNRTEHSLSVKSIYGVYNCSEKNRDIITCNDCLFEVSKPTNKNHAVNQATIYHRRYLDGTYGLFTRCGYCRDLYNISRNGSVYKYADGTIVDPSDMRDNAVVYNENGWYRTMTRYNYTECNYAPEIFSSVVGTVRPTSTRDWGGGDINTTLHYPDKVYEWLTRDQMATQPGGITYLEYKPIVVNAETGEEIIDIYVMERSRTSNYNENRIYYMNYFNVDDSTDNKITYAVVPELVLTHPTTNERIVYVGDMVILDNITELTITKAEISEVSQ